MNTALIIVVAALLALLLAIRLAPSDPVTWNVDPLTAADPGHRGVRLVPPDAKVYSLAPEVLLTAFDRVAMAAPRTKRLAGSVADGQITYVTRTKWLGFPDYLTVRVVAEADGASLAILSRSRFGGYDYNVNRTRVAAWLATLDTEIDD